MDILVDFMINLAIISGCLCSIGLFISMMVQFIKDMFRY